MPTLREQIEKLLRGEEFDGRDELIALGASAVPVLMDIAQHDAEALKRARALDVLGRLGDRQAIPLLKAALAAPTLTERVAAVEALAELAGKDAVSLLVGLVDDSEPALAKVVVQSLASVGDSSALAALERVRAQSTFAFLRAEADAAIGDIKGRIA